MAFPSQRRIKIYDLIIPGAGPAGYHIAGPYASEMVGAACVMIENEMLAGDIRELVFPHPTV